MLKKWHLIFTVFAIMLLLVSCGPTPPPPEITGKQMKVAIAEIMAGNEEVRGVGYSQEGKELSLDVSVDYTTSEERAKEIGDSFVRLVKTYGPDTAPSKEIGKGILDYLVTVKYPSGEPVVIGAKVSSADHVTWEAKKE